MNLLLKESLEITITEFIIPAILNVFPAEFKVKVILEIFLESDAKGVNFLKTKSILQPQKGPGNPVPMIINVRIIATSAPQVESRARAGSFNDELLLRLSKNCIEMPNLSERNDEYEDITMGILHEITRELHKEHVKGFSESAWRQLREYDWPGNLRELRNVLRMAVVSCVTERVELKDLPDFGHDKINFQAYQ